MQNSSDRAGRFAQNIIWINITGVVAWTIVSLLQTTGVITDVVEDILLAFIWIPLFGSLCVSAIRLELPRSVKVMITVCFICLVVQSTLNVTEEIESLDGIPVVGNHTISQSTIERFALIVAFMMTPITLSVLFANQHKLNVQLADRFAARSRELGAVNELLKHESSGRHTAESRLNRMDYAINIAGEGIFTVAADGRIIEANRMACERLEYSHEELLKMYIADIDPDFDRAVWPTHFEELRDIGHLVIQTRHETKSGRIFSVEVSIDYYEFDGQAFCCSFVRDITEQKKNEEELRRARDEFEQRVNERTQELSEAITQLKSAIAKREQAVALLQDIADGTSQHIGEEFFSSLVKCLAETLKVRYAFVADCVGQPPQRVRTKAFWAVDRMVENIEYDLDGTPCKKVIDGQTEVVKSAVQAKYPDDEDLKVLGAESYCGLPLKNAQGDVIGHLVVMDAEPLETDIADLPAIRIFADRAAAELQRNQAERALHLSRFAIQNAADAIYWVRQDGKLHFVNSAACEGLGYDANDLLKMVVSDIDPLYPLGPKRDRLWSRLRDHGRISFESVHRRKDGSEFPVEISANYLLFDGVEYNCAIVRDLTERKRVQQETEQLKNELAHVARLSTMGEMASGLAHELNQPLTAIANFADTALLLIDEARSKGLEEFREITREIGEQAFRAGEIIRRIRAFVKRAVDDSVALDLYELIEEVVELLRPDLRDVDVDLIMEIEPNLPLVRVDRIQLQQVVLNLLRNSIEALGSTSTPTIWVALRSTESDVEVRIEDNGGGLGSNPDQIFDAFYSTKSDGMGMGLAISRTIVETYSGKMWAETPDGRTAVCFSLPTTRESGHGNDRRFTTRNAPG